MSAFALSSGPSRYTARLIASLLIAVLVALCSVQLLLDYRGAVAQTETLVTSMANAIGQYLDDSIRSIDDILQEVADVAEDGQWGRAQQNDKLKSKLQAIPEIRFLAVIGTDGRFIGETVPASDITYDDVNVADREYFTHQRDTAGEGSVWVGLPVVGRLTGERTIHFSRALHDRQGKFIGIVLAAVNPDVYADYLGTVLLEPEGGSGIFRSSGEVIARAPDHSKKFGINIAGSDLFVKGVQVAPSGVIRLTARIDANEKFLAYRTLAGLPLVVTSGITTRRALHSWVIMASIEAAMVLLFSGALYAFALQADRRATHAALYQQSLEEKVFERTSELFQASELAGEHSKRLEVVNDELRRLAQVTAHHLQEPVRPIVSYTQMARRKLGGVDPDVETWLSYVETGGLRLKALLRDFQRYATALAEYPVMLPLDSAEIAAQAVSNLSHSIHDSGAEITLGDLPKLTGDKEMLLGVFRQLLDNAIRHRHPDRRPQVTVRAELAGLFWEFSVEDNGQGIAPSLAAKAFEAFERLGATSVDSTGLGLAICRAVIQAHGGRIWIESKEEGCCLHFTLPREQAAQG